MECKEEIGAKDKFLAWATGWMHLTKVGAGCVWRGHISRVVFWP